MAQATKTLKDRIVQVAVYKGVKFANKQYAVGINTTRKIVFCTCGGSKNAAAATGVPGVCSHIRRAAGEKGAKAAKAKLVAQFMAKQPEAMYMTA